MATQRLISYPGIIIATSCLTHNLWTIVYQGVQGMTMRRIHRSSAASNRAPCFMAQQPAGTELSAIFSWWHHWEYEVNMPDWGCENKPAVWWLKSQVQKRDQAMKKNSQNNHFSYINSAQWHKTTFVQDLSPTQRTKNTETTQDYISVGRTGLQRVHKELRARATAQYYSTGQDTVQPAEILN